MKLLVYFCTPCLVVALISCSTIRVSFDYDREADFSNLKTFAWLPAPQRDKGVESAVKQVMEALNQQLADKGLTSETDKPDFLIAVHGGKVAKLDIVDWGYSAGGPGRYGRYGPYGTSRRIDVREYKEGTLVLDFIDAETKELIWRGSATDVLEPDTTPEKRRLKIQEAVTKILAKFPPPR